MVFLLLGLGSSFVFLLVGILLVGLLMVFLLLGLGNKKTSNHLLLLI